MLKVIEDLSYVVLLRKKFSYIESIPGVLLPHPSSSQMFPYKVVDNYGTTPDAWHFQASLGLLPQTHHDFYEHQYNNNNNNSSQPLKNIITPSMSSLEALLSKLPSVVPPPPMAAAAAGQAACFSQFQRQPPLEFDMGMEKVTKDEIKEDEGSYRLERDSGESSSSMPGLRHHHFHRHQDHHNVASSTGPNSGF